MKYDLLKDGLSDRKPCDEPSQHHVMQLSLHNMQCSSAVPEN